LTVVTSCFHDRYKLLVIAFSINLEKKFRLEEKLPKGKIRHHSSRELNTMLG
jgi:hypothetical protein